MYTWLWNVYMAKGHSNYVVDFRKQIRVCIWSEIFQFHRSHKHIFVVRCLSRRCPASIKNSRPYSRFRELRISVCFSHIGERRVYVMYANLNTNTHSHRDAHRSRTPSTRVVLDNYAKLLSIKFVMQNVLGAIN